MTSRPEVALVVATYQHPEHLRRSLLSIAQQKHVTGKFELVVTDDGSTDETPAVVAAFAKSVGFPVQFVTHPHGTHEVARCRNQGAAATTAPYLLFLDGDCVLPPDHVAVHLRHRRPGWALGADCCRLDRATSARVTDDVIRGGKFVAWTPRSEAKRLAKKHRKARFYRWLGHPTKPKLIGNNIAVWREDFERVNGFDEKFQGWGCEDDDFRLRLRQAGVRIDSILRWTYTYHLWHPTDPTAPASQRWRDGANAKYIQRKYRLTRCLNGARKRSPASLQVRAAGSPPSTDVARKLRLVDFAPAADRAPTEVELLVVPGGGRFSGRAECNILVVTQPCPLAARLARHAHLVLADHPCRGVDERNRFSLDQFDRALDAVA